MVWILFLLNAATKMLVPLTGIKARHGGSDHHDFGLRHFGFEVP